jgi:membrane protease YdiL (CAAX protease family)
MHDLSATLLTISLLMIFAALLVSLNWALLARVPWEPRRPVPWNGLDVLVVLGAYVLLLWTLLIAAHWGLGIPIDTRSGTSPGGSQTVSFVGKDRTAAGGKNREDPLANEKTAMNPVLVVLARRRQPGTLLLCGFAAVLAAPLSEEFFFRLLLQGWLEAVEGRWRKRFRLLRRLTPGLLTTCLRYIFSALPMLLVSALFAAVHFRKEAPPGNVDALLAQFVLNGVAELLTVAFAVGYLQFRTGATAADLGFIHEKLPRDLALGLAAIALCIPLLIFIQFATASILPKTTAADPVTLFFFAAVMGTIYFRTHRIVPSIVMHVAFNAVMLAAAWYLVKT